MTLVGEVPVRNPVSNRRSRLSKAPAPLRWLGTLVQWAFSLAVGYAIWRWLFVPHFSTVVVANIGPIWDSLKMSFDNGSLWHDTRITLYESLVGFGVGLGVGLVLALAIALLPRVISKVIEPIVVVIYAAPKFVLVPIMFVQFGSGFFPRMLLVSIAIFPVITIYVLGGLRTVAPETVAVMGMFGASRRQIATKLMIPHASSYLATAIAYSIPHALAMAIGAEILFGTTDGLGGVMFEDSQSFNASGIYAYLAVATVIALIFMAAAGRIATGWSQQRQGPRRSSEPASMPQGADSVPPVVPS